MKRFIAVLLLLLLTSPAYAWTDAKFNFRGSSAFINTTTETSNGETYVIDTTGTSGGGQGEQYSTPTVRNAITFGWDNNTVETRDRDAVTPPLEFAGLHRNGAANLGTFRVDLPAPGSYTIKFAAGDYIQSCANTIEILDNTTSLFTVTGTTSGGDAFLDATGVERTSTNWAANNVGVTHTFATTTFIMKIGDGAGLNTGNIAHLEILTASAAAETFGFYRRRAQ